MKCSKCGNLLPEDSEFCQYCGIHLGNHPSIDIQTEEAIFSTNVVSPTESVVSASVSDNESDEKLVAGEKVVKKSKLRYCKLCGHAVDGVTKKCTGCGKQYFKAKLKPLYVVLAIFILLSGYVGVNYFCAVSAMNDQKFIESQQYFDNLFVSKTIFSAKYAYVEAGVLMEEGKYIASLNAFSKLDNIPIPVSITDNLKSKIYSSGQAAYQAGNMTEAKKNFDAISNYRRSDDYLILISCSENSNLDSSSAFVNYVRLLKLLGFENADEIMLKNMSTAELFLNGRWEDGNKNPHYFELQYESDGGWYSQYNLPHKDAEGDYYISNGIYSVGETELSAAKYFKFSIINRDTISVYCYKDGSTHKLYRQ